MTGTDLHDPLRALGGTRRAHVVPDLKILYISIAKNACTTIKWLISELAGEDPAQFALGSGPFVSEDEGIHPRKRWKHTPTLDQLEPELRASISPENGWFVFSVVRDPRIRLFSAWQNKLLMRSPAYTKWRDEPWYPQVPRNADDVIEDFARFVDVLRTEPNLPVADDAHFQAQVPYLAEDVVPYSSIYEIGRLTTMVADLETHVQGLGHDGQLELRRSNDTPLRATAAVFAGGVREQVESLFAQDFERFGDLWDFSRVESAASWSTDAIAGLRAQIVMSERISDLISQVKRGRTKTAQRDATIDRLLEELAWTRASNRRLRAAATLEPAWKRAARPLVRAVRSRLHR